MVKGCVGAILAPSSAIPYVPLMGLGGQASPIMEVIRKLEAQGVITEIARAGRVRVVEGRQVTGGGEGFGIRQGGPLSNSDVTLCNGFAFISQRKKRHNCNWGIYAIMMHTAALCFLGYTWLLAIPLILGS